jgi:hypothetical protein
VFVAPAGWSVPSFDVKVSELAVKETVQLPVCVELEGFAVMVKVPAVLNTNSSPGSTVVASGKRMARTPVSPGVLGGMWTGRT